MQELLMNVGDRIYDQESKENIERLKSFLLQAQSQVVGLLYRLLDKADGWAEVHGRFASCDGTIVCNARAHTTKCYGDNATDLQWRNQMAKYLEGAK